MTRSFPMRLLSVLLTLVLAFTLTEPASAKGESFSFGKTSETSVKSDFPVSEKNRETSGESLFEGPEDGLPDGSEDGLFPDEERIVLPPEVIAEEISDPFHSPFEQEPLEIKDVNIRGELSEKRDEYQKQFYLTDGSYGSVTYIYPVHEKDPEGEWQEIDNRLESVKDPDGLSFYTRKGLHDTVKFYETPCKDILYTVETGSGLIRWGLQGMDEETEAELLPAEIPEGYSLLVPKSAGDLLKYEEVLAGIDSLYRLIGHTLKEDVILKDRDSLETIRDPETGTVSLSFRLSLKGYTAVQKDERTITIPDREGKAVYELSAPVMTDSEGAVSEGLVLSLEPMEGDGENVYTVTTSFTGTAIRGRRENWSPRASITPAGTRIP